MDSRPLRLTLIKTSTVLLILLAVMAWYSNPDEPSFNRWVNREVQNHAASNWERLSGRVLTPLAIATLDIERRNFGFFSFVIVHMDKTDVCFLGLFGEWKRIT